MVEKFKGNNPKNARIKIDYSGVKPKVTFSYPSKKYGTVGSMLPFIYVGWIIFLLIGSFFFTLGATLVIADLETNQSTNFSNYSQCFAYKMQEAEVIANETCSTPKLSDSEIVMNSLKEIFTLSKLLAFLLIFIPPLLIYFPFKNFWANVFPKFMARNKGTQKIAKFYPKDVKHSSEDGYYCEIPVFKNVILDYNAKEDFSKYLKLFEIKEHKFKYYKPINRKRKKKLTKKDKKERRKEMLNDYLWYAKFYFSQKPTKGSLEVIFK